MTRKNIKHMLYTLCVSIILLGSVFIASGDTSKVGFSDFRFSYLGTEYAPTLTLSLTGGTETGFTFSIFNKEDTAMSYAFSFVDGYYTSPDNLRACKSEKETSTFGQYISGDTSSLTIGSYETGTRSFTVKFPNSYSGLYLGCIMYYPVTTGDDNQLITLPRRGGFLDANVTSLSKDFTITVRPAFRSTSNTTGYSLQNIDFRFFIYDGGQWTGLYNSAKNPLDQKLTTDAQGRGIISFIPPTNGTQYLIAMKGSGTLSLGFTGIWNDTIDEFNFFSGTLASTLSNEFMFDYNNEYYLKVGDTVAYDSGTFDFIKDPDFALMTNYLTISGTPLHPSRFDLDTNNTINSLEQTMLLDSYNRRGFMTTQQYVPFTEFIIL